MGITTTRLLVLLWTAFFGGNRQHNLTENVLFSERMNVRFGYENFLSNHHQSAQEAGHFLL